MMYNYVCWQCGYEHRRFGKGEYECPNCPNDGLAHVEHDDTALIGAFGAYRYSKRSYSNPRYTGDGER